MNASRELRTCFYYVGPTVAMPYGICAYLPEISLGLFEDHGFLVVAWLFWAFEVNWAGRTTA
jgi:hypothetical protein